MCEESYGNKRHEATCDMVREEADRNVANSERMSDQETVARDLSSLAVVDALLAELRGWDRNPRRIKPARLEQLKAMLVSSPEMLKARPLICLPDGTVIAGNQRLAAAQALGWESIPAVFVDLDEATAIEWAFRDNNPAGESDDDLAALLLADLAERGRALDMTGFAPSELSALLRRVAPKNDPDAVPPVPELPKSKRGEIYELGMHRLMCGDATSAEDVGMLLAGETTALMVTDPPYGVGVDHRWREDADKTRRGGARGPIQGDDHHDWLEAYQLTTAPVGGLRVALLAARRSGPGRTRGCRIRSATANRVGEGRTRARPSGLPVEARDLLVRGAQGRHGTLEWWSQADDGLGSRFADHVWRRT